MCLLGIGYFNGFYLFGKLEFDEKIELDGFVVEKFVALQSNNDIF